MSTSRSERNFPTLRQADRLGADDPVEARKRVLKQLSRRQDRRAAEQEAVGNDLPQARRVALVERALDGGQQRLALLSENGRIGEGPRADRPSESLGAKLHLDVDGQAAPVHVARTSPDLQAQHARAVFSSAFVNRNTRPLVRQNRNLLLGGGKRRPITPGLSVAGVTDAREADQDHGPSGGLRNQRADHQTVRSVEIAHVPDIQ